MTGRRSRSLLVALAMVPSAAACGPGSTPPGAPGTTPVVAILRAVRSPEPRNVEVFIAELAQAGFAEPKTLRIVGADPAEVHPDPAEAEATVREWARLRLDLVLALSSAGARAAAQAAPEAAVLFLSNDPIAAGLVDNERRPGGRLTGATFRVPPDRTLELARRALPGLSRVGLLFPSSDPAAAPVRQAMVRAGAALGMEVVLGGFAADADVPAAVEGLRTQGVGAVVLANAPATVRAYPVIAPALEAAGLPAIANTSAGFALLVLEPDAAVLYRQLGRQAVRLLRGAPVSQVPVEDPGRFRLTVSLVAAGRLGRDLPAEVLRSADSVVRP